jgi:transposase
MYKLPRQAKDEIKAALLGKGGLVIAERGSGKTQALVEILLENENAVVVASGHYRDNILSYLREAGLPFDIAYRKIISPNQKLYGPLLTKDIYVEEYWASNYTGPFKAAVTSYPFPVTVIGD